MKLSIIVPVYNTERFISRCIDSLLCLNISDYEILLIDDGSTDFSGKICDEYEAKYNIVKAFHKKNGGSTSARLLGLANSCGKYIAFVDSDDWVGENIFSEFLSAMESDSSLDACIGGLMKVFPDGERKQICPSYPAKAMTNVETMMEMLKWKKFRWELCGNIYRRHLFRGFSPPEEIAVGEDLISNFYLLREARKILYLPIYQYFYFTNTGSLTESYKSKLNSIMKPFYNISNMSIEHEDLFQLIELLYTREIIKDIWYRIFYNEFADYCSFYRNELKKIMFVNDVHCFLAEHFDIDRLQQSMRENDSFYEFWKAMFDDLVRKLHLCRHRYRNVYLYGTGVISKFLCGIMENFDIGYDGCVISDGQGKKSNEVKYLSEISCENNESIFILSLASVYHNDVINNLQERGYTNYLVIDIISDMYR